jgi:hypothetical protein
LRVVAQSLQELLFHGNDKSNNFIKESHFFAVINEQSDTTKLCIINANNFVNIYYYFIFITLALIKVLLVNAKVKPAGKGISKV